MVKLVILIAIIVIVFKWFTGRWPWEKRISTRAQAVFNARKLLGLEENANRSEINTAHKRLVAMIHPDRGGSNAQVHEANDARDLLFDELPHDISGPQ